MTHAPIFAKVVTAVGTVTAEVALLQASSSVEDWLMKNVFVIAAVLIAWGMLKRDVEHMKETIKEKASSDRVDGLDGKLDLVLQEVQHARALLEGRHR